MHFRASAIKIKGVHRLSKERHTLAYTKFVTLLRTKPSETKTCISLIDSKIGTLSALFVDCMSKCIKDAIKVHTSPRLFRSKPFHFYHIIVKMNILENHSSDSFTVHFSVVIWRLLIHEIFRSKNIAFFFVLNFCNVDCSYNVAINARNKIPEA